MSTGSPSDTLSPLKRAFIALEQTQAKLEALERARSEPIAIVGIGCRFPGGAGSPDTFWDLLAAGMSGVREVPADRWPVDAHFDADPDAPGKMYTRWAAFLDEVDKFEPQFFGIAPREAVHMDPQQRLLLEVAWEALENAGQSPDKLHGSRSGVFFGLCTTDYEHIQGGDRDLARLDTYSQSGLAHSIASGRVSYVLGLQGPSISVDTACSSSLVAVHLACQSLRSDECRLALAGGVHMILTPHNSVAFSRTRMVAADGRCKTFDATADGFVEGEGCGIVVLKRLSDALADRDRIVAVIRGSAVNQDGPSSGLTVPNGPAQESVVRDALARAGMRPADIDYIEAHGTGTPLGDPIEVQALGAVFREDRPSGNPLRLGSVKTNLGHLQAAAGIAGLIKTVLALEHETLPPHLNFSVPNPHVPWATLPVKVTSLSEPWLRGSRPRAAGISAFGFSGTNAHVIVQEAPLAPDNKPAAVRPAHVLTLSARSESALATLAGHWSEKLALSREADPGDICFTANAGRAHLAYRAATVVASREQASERLASIASGTAGREIAQGHVPSSEKPKIAFLFTGQGSQSANMARQLYETQPTFRAALDRCDAALRARLPRPLLSVIYPDRPDDRTIDQTAFTQPALFAIEYALAELWRSWGVVPGAVLGHSLGEYVAATVAGVFDLEDALHLVATRARLMQSLPAGGAMAAVLADEATVRAAVAPFDGRISIAAINGPRNTVISGTGEAIADVVSRLASAGVTAEKLTVSHAFHSALMEPILDEFEAAVAAANPKPANLLLASNLTGAAARRETADPAYWRRHLRQPVLFAQGINTLYAQGYRVFVEAGPRPVLCGMGQRVLGQPDAVWLASLKTGRDDWGQLLDTLAQLHVRGAAIDWNGFDKDYPRRRRSLPTYPFERARYWVADAPSQDRQPVSRNGHPLLGPAIRTALGPVVFESTIDTRTQRFLEDHQKHGVPVFPATAYLEMGMAAARDALGPGEYVLDDLVINEPLLVGDEPATVQAVVSSGEHGASQFQLFRRTDGADGGAGWRLHATGSLRSEPAPQSGGTDTLAGVRARCAEPMPLEHYYESLLADGHGYGPAFQGIKGLWRGDCEALGRIELPEAIASEAHAYRLHPALLDAAIQILSTGAPESLRKQSAGETFLPVSLGRFRVFLDGARAGWSHARLRDLATDGFACDIRVYDDDGGVIAELLDVYHRRARVIAPERSVPAPSLCEIVWRMKPREAPASGAQPGTWAIVSRAGELAASIAGRLAGAGARTVLIEPAAGYRALDDGGRLAVDTADPEQVRRALQEVRDGWGGLTGIVHLASGSAAAADPDIAALSEALRAESRTLLHLMQAIGDADGASPPRLCVVTSGAMSVGDAQRPVAVVQAPLWGMARTFVTEHPDIPCSAIDIDPRSPAADVDALCAEILGPDAETQVAFRDGLRYAARLVPGEWEAAPDAADGRPLALEITERGTLDTLSLVETSRRPPGDGEVEVQISAAGLNFRDVLNALGMYHGEAGPLGGECVGRVVAVGPGVESLKPGDDVMGMAIGTFGHFVTAPADAFIVKPANLSAEDAATIPIVFLTALYGLSRLARMKAGDRVLIHAAAGGVGVACVRLAQRAGAEIFATAGSPEKHAFLRSLGVQHIMSSRSLDFAPRILELTGGAGVDIVMNSLAGEFIDKSVEVTAKGGRFIEIGRTGIWTAEQMAAVRPDIEYFPFLLRHDNLSLIQSLLQELTPAFASGALLPLPRRTFALKNAADAFRYMAQARHIGKIVLAVQNIGQAQDRPAFDAGSTYLVTGGLGALGLNVARWMVSAGARHVVLTSRRGAGAEAAGTLAEMEAAGAQVRVVKADVASAADADRLFEEIASGPPLRGIVHAAGVIDDGMLAQQTWERFETVLAPKVLGAWNLHERTRSSSLDFFVMFSSMVSVLGGPGQGNYVAANVFLDALAHHRRGLGLPGLSLDWGPWAGAGMASTVSERDKARWSEQGYGLVGIEQGLQVLEQLIDRSPSPQIAVLPFDWAKVFRQFPGRSEPRLLGELADRYARPAAAPASQRRLMDEIEAAAPNSRRGLVASFIREQALRVLGLEADAAIDGRQPLGELGLDSLMAVELRNVMSRALERTLPATVLFKYPTIEALSDYVLESSQIEATPARAAAAGEGGAAGEGAAAGEEAGAGVEALSDESVRKLLEEELESLSKSDWFRMAD
jgi:myxalamid-type polyketide synthase MxaB